MDDNNQHNHTKVISTGEWIITKFLMLIPVINIILLFVWAFSNKENINKANWAKATLVIYLVRFALYLIILFTLLSLFMSPLREETILF